MIRKEHDSEGNRILGFDNAHARLGSLAKEPYDHIHKGKIKPYKYTNASRRMEDFWTEVEMILKERGINL